MRAFILPALALAAAIAAGPASATDTSSLSAFLSSCSPDMKGCKSIVFDLITAAKTNHYGCIPHDLSADRAADMELDWLKNTAGGNPKYEKMNLQDVMWDGVDELWPCHRK